MRVQVLLPLVLFSLLAVLAIVIPVGESIAVSRTQQLELARASSMDHIVRLGENALTSGDTTSLARYLARFGSVSHESVIVLDGEGDQIAKVGVLSADDPAVRSHALASSRNLPQWQLPTLTPWSVGAPLVSKPILGSGELSMGVVVLQVNTTAARHDVAAAWLLVALVALLVIGLLVGASLWWTNWVLRPVRALDEATNAFGEHHDVRLVAATGPPELRRLAASFSRMARGIEETLVQQRNFVADASHQLRNPLAAIRLRIDALAGVGHGARSLETVDADLDRLESTVGRMLVLADVEHRATARASGDTTTIDASFREHTVPSAAALAEPFRPLVDAAGQTLITEGTTEVRLACRRSDLEEIVATLLENAGKYAGEGAIVRLCLAQESHPDGDVVSVSVSDDGPGLDDAELAQAGTRFWRSARHRGQPGTGLGLAIVGQLVRANGGTLRIDRAAEGGLRIVMRFEAIV
ncbi:HAMP domain-containing histidine kinase [Microbacterium protaetiae]|uniref:histidine kinase n=1 Tax=Microbacterium protaetiae TaxID=2509458 RepID=A0A4P6ECM7_9MICO|nr:HAMP domain-containing sensor histidine kinase [Microbacterium protaetiae]QAY59103.1 HAMP domain-containing histidine kinase [Microbacterium protaetiae]